MSQPPDQYSSQTPLHGPKLIRLEGRASEELRPLEIELGISRHAEGSALVKMGYTHVLCTASVEETVPKWLTGKKQGWVTAEYSMLPRATHTRSKRDREKISGRTQEIQRLIGRALRGMVNLQELGERSIFIDCDVLQADGGTRTASINGGCVALVLALQGLVKTGKLQKLPLIDTVSAISLGLRQGDFLLDLDYEEDSSCDVDMNFVITGKGQIIEVQGTAERQSFTQDQLMKFTSLALRATQTISQFQKRKLSLQ